MLTWPTRETLTEAKSVKESREDTTLREQDVEMSVLKVMAEMAKEKEKTNKKYSTLRAFKRRVNLTTRFRSC